MSSFLLLGAGTDATAGGGSLTTLNPADLANVTLSNGNLTATGNGSVGGVRGTTSHAQSSGKWIFEIKIGTANASLNANDAIGLTSSGTALTTAGPTLNPAFVYAPSGGGLYKNGSAIDFIVTATLNDVITFAVDLSGTGAVSIFKNGAAMGGLGNPYVISTLTFPVLPFISSSGTSIFTANFGQSGFTAPQAGYSNW